MNKNIHSVTIKTDNSEFLLENGCKDWHIPTMKFYATITKRKN